MVLVNEWRWSKITFIQRIPFSSHLNNNRRLSQMKELLPREQDPKPALQQDDSAKHFLMKQILSMCNHTEDQRTYFIQTYKKSRKKWRPSASFISILNNKQIYIWNVILYAEILMCFPESNYSSEKCSENCPSENSYRINASHPRNKSVPATSQKSHNVWTHMICIFFPKILWKKVQMVFLKKTIKIKKIVGLNSGSE